MTDKVIDINDESDIKDILNTKDKYILLYFTASWCGPCKQISPVIHEKFTKINNLQIYKIDIDDNDDLCTTYDIKSVPTFILIYNKHIKMIYKGSDSIQLLKNIKDIFNNN